jgi:CxxC motif-containing protein (DUF1111 family)
MSAGLLKYMFASLLICVGLAQVCQAQDDIDISALGGDLTSDLPAPATIQVNAPNVTNEERRQTQLAGFAHFHRSFSRDDGLGPSFVNVSCGKCHVNNTKGPLRFSRVNRGGSAMVVKSSLSGLQENGAPIDVPGMGEQLLDQSIAGSPRKARITLDWRFIDGKYPDGRKYKLRRPVLRFTIDGSSRRKVLTSLRMTPAVIGPGLLEAIPDDVILEFSDPQDANGDGISGHPNYVPNLKTQEFEIGRFGFRASHPTTEQQTVAALFHDIGIATSIIPDETNVPEFNDSDLEQLVVYQKLAGVPRARNQDDPKVQEGKQLFQEVGCDDCHRMTMRTEEHEDPELSNQEFHPFTDLLLHDMGPGLSDRRAEFSATGSEWKTTPLWGLGYVNELLGGTATFLHDGRARTVEEAILWHSGEANTARQAFRKLSRKQRQALIAFLKSL